MDVDEVPSSGSLGVQFVGDMPIFLDGLPGGVRVLHSTPDCTVAQFCVCGCYFMLGHRIWSQGAACDIGMMREFQGYCAFAAGWRVVISVLDVS